MERDLTIGRLARAAGVSVETVRYYHRLDLVPRPPRPARGARRYPGETVARLRFIRRAQTLGFTLAEIAHLLGLGEPRGCAAARSLAAERVALVRARIAELERMRAALESLIGRCDAGRGESACPIIESLSLPA